MHARRAVVCHAEDQDPIGVRHHGRAQQSAARLRARRHDARPAASLVAPEEGKRPLDGGGLIAAHEIEEVRVVVGGVVGESVEANQDGVQRASAHEKLQGEDHFLLLEGRAERHVL